MAAKRYGLRTGRSESLTSQTAALEPTENSRSSLVIAMRMSNFPNRDQLTVPVFVHHHHTEQHAEREEEEAVNVVAHGITNLDRECKENDAANRIEGDAKNLVE